MIRGAEMAGQEFLFTLQFARYLLEIRKVLLRSHLAIYKEIIQSFLNGIGVHGIFWFLLIQLPVSTAKMNRMMLRSFRIRIEISCFSFLVDCFILMESG